MNRYHTMFSRLEQEKAGAFIPFVTIGDPNLDQSYTIIRTLILAGADALELGLPFSDPIADGPTIQAANIRALSQPTSTQACLDLVARIREEFPELPIGLLLYSNLIVAKGINHFYRIAKQAGVDSVLIADVPIRESKPFRLAAKEAGIAPVFIVAPNVKDETLRQIASYGRGYTYLLSRVGVTGAETQAQAPASDMIDRLKLYGAAPAVLGFGISSPEQVAQALESGAMGAISGSAVVNIIEQHLGDKDAMLEALARFVFEMKSATSST